MSAKPTYEELEAALRESETRGRTLLSLYSFPVTLTHLQEGTYILVNEAFTRSTGYSAEEVAGLTPKDIDLYIDPEARRRLVETLQTVGLVKDFEIDFRAKDGTVYHNKISASLIRFKGQECMLAVTTFVTPLWKMQHALRQTEERFRTILDNISEAYYEVDLTGRFTFFNNALPTMTGYAAEELQGLSYKDYTAPAEAQRIFQVFNGVYRAGGTGKMLDYTMIRKDGVVIVLEASVSLLRDAAGGAIGFYGILRDRTEQKRAEDALRRSEESYRHLLELAPDSITVTRIADGRYMQVNDVCCQRTGFRREEIIGRTVTELEIYENPDDRRRLMEALRLHARIEGMQVRFRSKSGEYLDNLISARPLQFEGEACLLTISTNISSLKAAQQALHLSEEKYRQILETMEEGYYEIDLEGNFTYFNESTRRLHGYPAAELMGMNYQRYLHPETADAFYRTFVQIYKIGKPQTILEYEVIRKDGTRRLCEMSAYLKKTPAGEPIGFWGISRDRTERKQAEIMRQESEERLRSIFENANDCIYVTQNGRIAFLNPKTVAVTGYPADILHDMPFTNLVYPEDRSSIYEPHYRTVAHEHLPAVFSFRILNREQEIVWVELNGISISWEGRPAVLNFLRDITPQKKMEALLLQSRKMEAVGTLAGGIAHDFNNLLMGIQGNTSLALMDADLQHPLYDKLKNIEHYVRAGAELTRQLLGTARGGKYEVVPICLNQVVDASADLFGRTRKEISIHKRLSESLWTVEVDRSQIEQVLLNLFVNAWHAMPEGGTLFLESHNAFLDEFYVQPYGVQPGKYVKLSVTDTGIGIDPKDQKRIFDPFFTTKGMSRGTGLGLSSAYGIISNHGGIISVYSEKNSGTTFNIYLPACEKEVFEFSPPVLDVVPGKETILFVDDEVGIVEVGSLILEKLGYTVIAAHGGAEAVAIFQKQKETIDLVLLDMIMPGMSGSDTFGALQAIAPDVKVVLSSGYSINGQAKGIIDRGCQGFIQKPFSMQDLSKKLREVLDAGK